MQQNDPKMKCTVRIYQS